MLYSLSLLVLADASQICEEHACRHALVKRFAPVYRLDKNFKCFPGAPALVYEARKANESEVICEDAGKLHEVPIFYHYEQCNEEVVVVDYWLWYSHQGPCMTILGKDYGAHAGDWERIAVHIKNDRVKAVRFHQHSGSYTKHRSEIDFVDEHPVSYSGQDSHGNYHDQGGTGNCLYFQDFRRWDDKTLKVEAWKNPLWSIKNGSADLPEWFNGDREYLDGYPPPSELRRRSGCGMLACKGKDEWDAASGVCGGTVCGCRKSDYCDAKQFGDLGGREECKDSSFNEAVKDVKEGLNSLIGSSAVSAAQPLAAWPLLWLARAVEG